MEAKLNGDGKGVLVRTRDANQFYLLLNRIVVEEGIGLEAVAPADDDVNSVLSVPDRQRRRSRMNALVSVRKSLVEAPWRLWTAQVMAILRVELRRNLWMRRRIAIYLVALGPVVLIGFHGLESPFGRHCNLSEDTEILAVIFQVFYLRLGIFFGCLGLFTWLFRGEIVEKSLHYYFLAPMRREVLVAGKFLAGLELPRSFSVLRCCSLSL